MMFCSVWQLKSLENVGLFQGVGRGWWSKLQIASPRVMREGPEVESGSAGLSFKKKRGGEIGW